MRLRREALSVGSVPVYGQTYGQLTGSEELLKWSSTAAVLLGSEYEQTG